MAKRKVDATWVVMGGKQGEIALDGKTTYVYGVKMTHEEAAAALRDGSWVSL